MEVIKTEIDGVVIIEPRIFKDDRGYFYESFSQREFEEKVCRTTFVQDNQSKSSYGVVRGLHFQKPPYSQSKLVRCIKGAVLDVAVDIRKGSPTFGKYVAVAAAWAVPYLYFNNHFMDGILREKASTQVASAVVYFVLVAVATTLIDKFAPWIFLDEKKKSKA